LVLARKFEPAVLKVMSAALRDSYAMELTADWPMKNYGWTNYIRFARVSQRRNEQKFGRYITHGITL
jgi:hypothetical protein